MAGEFVHRPLGSVARVRSGYAFKSGDMGTWGAPIIKIKNICPPTVDINDCERVSERVIACIPGIERYELKHGDILIAMTGATVGKVGRFPKVEERYFLNQRVGKVYLVEDNAADYRYLYYVLSQDAYVRAMFGVADGSAQANISGGQIEKLEIPLPELREQQAIACILGALDDKIELNRRMNRTLEEMARAIFKSWFVDFDPVRAKAAVRREHPKWTDEQVSRAACPNLNPKIAALFPDAFEPSELGEIPKGWIAPKVGQYFRLTMGQSPPGSTYNETGDGTPFYQGRTDFGFRYPTRRVYCTAPTRFAEPGDTLVSVRAPVGDVNIAKERCAVGRGVAAIRHRSNSRSFTYCAMHQLAEHFLKFEAEGTVFGCINKADFERLPFVEPSPEVLAVFDRIVSPLDDRIETNEEQALSLANMRDTLLPKLISGELRVPDAERIVGRCV